ncbi:hypothetical protein [Streptomyces sp. NBC_00859]|uniref:hypothetical protein n=1 Tax=Streptomyces sp. NBC_00859 TaxID=2903682 RepID=UPI00386941BA|nr:hypothetical protein OG584_23615 [Streptomyces sp. NBC_00859]
MRTQTMNGLAAAVAALDSLVERFPDLPAADVNVSTFYPDRLVLSFHGDRGEKNFEVWRSALGISYAAVSREQEIGGPLTWLIAETTVGGVTVRLIGYGERQAAAEQLAPCEVAT